MTAPSLSDADDSLPSTSGRPPAPQAPPPGPGPLRQAYKRLLRSLASLKLAIAELAVIGALSAVGTIIKQGEPYAYYAEVGRGVPQLQHTGTLAVCVGLGRAPELTCMRLCRFHRRVAHELLCFETCSLHMQPAWCLKQPLIPCRLPHTQNYPEEGQKVLGFLTGRLIWALQVRLAGQH